MKVWRQNWQALERPCLLVILAVALLLRVAVVWSLDIAPFSDFAGYESLAKGLLARHELGDAEGGLAFLSPGYPIFVLAPVFFVFNGSLLAAQMANAMLGVLVVWMTYRLAANAGAGRTGRLLSAAIMAVYLPSMIYAEYLAKENLMTPLILAVFMFAAQLVRGSRAWQAATCGLLLGVLAITGSAGLSVLPVLLLAGLYSPLPVRTRLLHGAILVATFAMVLAPWLARNQRLLGAPVITSNGGFNLYIGNNPAATGWFVSVSDTPMGKAWPELRKRGELVASNVLHDEAMRWISAHPAEFVGLTLRKAAYFWMPPVHEGKGQPMRGEALVRQAWLTEYLLVVGLAVLGLSLPALRNRKTALLWVGIASYCALHMFFYVIFRYREPLIPLMVVLAALTVERLVAGRKGPVRIHAA